VCNPIGDSLTPATTMPFPSVWALPGWLSRVAPLIFILSQTIQMTGDSRPLDPDRFIMCYKPVKVRTDHETICQYACPDGKNRHLVFWHPNAQCPDVYPFEKNVGWLDPGKQELREKEDDLWAYGYEANKQLRMDEGLFDRTESTPVRIEVSQERSSGLRRGDKTKMDGAVPR